MSCSQGHIIRFQIVNILADVPFSRVNSIFSKKVKKNICCISSFSDFWQNSNILVKKWNSSHGHFRHRIIHCVVIFNTLQIRKNKCLVFLVSIWSFFHPNYTPKLNLCKNVYFGLPWLPDNNIYQYLKWCYLTQLQRRDTNQRCETIQGGNIPESYFSIIICFFMIVSNKMQNILPSNQITWLLGRGRLWLECSIYRPFSPHFFIWIASRVATF